MYKDQIRFIVHSREQIVYDERVSSITSYNDKGKFDITPNHANFISLVQKSLLARKEDGTTKEIRVENGVLRFLDNNVSVYLGIKQTVF